VASTGSGNAGPVKTGAAAVSSNQTGSTAGHNAPGNNTDAAKAARAAFDALHTPAPAVTPKPRATEPPLEPEPEPEFKFESEPELNFGTGREAGIDVKSGSESAPGSHPTEDSGPAPEPAPKPPLKSAATSTGELTMQDWHDLQAGLELSGAARELARQLQLEAVDGRRWKFLVPDTVQLLGSESVVQNLQSALATHLGHAVRLDLHTASEPVKSVAAAAEHAEISRMSEAERSIEEDPTVRDIKAKFGAKIVPDSIQPLQ
jgi:DNA polymerase-3 subunit gamma/tau